MSWRSRPSAWASALLLLALPCESRAQGWREVGIVAAGLDSRPAVMTGGVSYAWRDEGRTRIGAALMGGADEQGHAALRAEVAWHFLLDPARDHGLALYGGGGLAVSAVEGDRARPWVLAVLGVETAPAAGTGFFLEAGFGGGARAALGLRFRRRTLKQNAPGG